MKNLLKRIRQLEQHVPVQSAARTEEDSPLSEAFYRLLISMDEHHAGLILKIWKTRTTIPQVSSGG